MEKTKRIIKYFIIGGVFLLPFLPLVVSDQLFFPFITGKNFLFRVIVEFIFVLWIILAVNDKKYRPKKSLILTFLFVFTALMALSAVFGENPYRSFWSNYERMEGLVTYLHILAYFLVLITILNTEKLWKLFFHISLMASFLVACYGILQLAGVKPIHQSDVRLDSTIGNASYLATYMLFHIFLALMFFLKEKSWWKWFYLPFIVLNAIILYHTATRGVIFGLVGGLVLFLLLTAVFSKEKRRKIFTLSLLGFIFLSVAVFWTQRDSSFVKQSPVLSRFSNISFQDQSRFVVWNMSWQGVKEKPILGWGPENYNLVFNKYYAPVLYSQEPWFDRAHNVFFDKLVTTGILGLLSYLGLFVSAIYYLFKKNYRNNFSVFETTVITSLFAAYFFNNIFVFDNLLSLFLFFSVLGYIHFHNTSLIIEEKKKENTVSVYSRESNFLISSSLAVIVFIYFFYFINIPAFLANRTIIDALEAAANGQIQDALGKFEKALSYNSFGNSEIREHLTSFALKVVAASDNLINNETKTKVFEKASSEMKKQIEVSPNDIRYLLFLSSLYNGAGRYDEAIIILEKALKLSPKKQQIYFELGSALLNKKEYAKAAEILKTAFELDSSYDDARKIYALGLVYDGKIDLAEEIIKKRYGVSVIPDLRLANAYAGRGESKKAAQIFEKIIEQNPSNAQYRVNLAANYLKINEKEKAIEQLQKAIELEPKFKQQGEYLINEIKAGRNP